MQCKCGNNMTTQVHEVKTLKKGKEWFDAAIESIMPLQIHQNKCGACGRLHYKVADNKGNLVKTFN